MNGNEFRIVMLGASGVGKTSTLTAMYDKIGDIRRIIGFQPNEITNNLLTLRRQELEALAAAPAAHNGDNGDNGDVGITGTQSQRTFRFTVRSQNNDRLDLIFQDYPGSYLKDSKKKKEVIGWIEDSKVLIVPIDTIALMANDGQWNELRNQTTEISALIKDVYQQLNTQNTQRLVIFTLVKCETYIKNPGQKNLVTATFVQEYDDLLNFFETEMGDRVAVVCVPVHTLGCVRLDHIEVVDGEPRYHLARDAQANGYDPEGGERLLRYILRFLLTIHQQNQSNPQNPGHGLWEWLNRLFGNNNEFVQAVQWFALQDEVIDKLAVIQGKKLLGSGDNNI